MITIEGHIKKTTYFNEENFYTIAQFLTKSPQTTITIVGYISGVNEGEPLKLCGRWETHSKYGQQFKIDTFEPVLPTTNDEITKYLKALSIKGLNKKKIKSLVRTFETDTFNIIENTPLRLKEISGFGKVLAERVHTAWIKHHSARVLVKFLKENEIPVALSAMIIKTLGTRAVEAIKQNPYQLLEKIEGIDFNLIDKLARKLDFEREAPIRVRACIYHLLNLSSSDGHVFMYHDLLLKRCQNFGIKPDTTQDVLNKMIDSGDLFIENFETGHPSTAIYTSDMYLAEKGIASKIKALLSIPSCHIKLKRSQIVDEILTKLAIEPSDEQLGALEEILNHKAVIITGGPGTGKTTLVRSIISIFSLTGMKCILAAPTGRAARRLSEVTQKKASTLHKLLLYNQSEGIFERNEKNPLDADAVIIDEASMIDTILMYHLFNALQLTSTIILVGDIFQLPSVGPGNILSDIIGSKMVKTFELKKIFRQAQESPIIVNAHKIRKGEIPDLKNRESAETLSEFYFIETNHPQKVVDRIVDMSARRIPQRYGFDPLTDIQILTPMHKGDVGTINLNQVLQDALNPDGSATEYMGRTFKTGDKVMHLINNYEKEVFNGDIGTIDKINKKEKTLFVNYYGRLVEYHFDELSELSLAYAISVHKSQGSEYSAIVIPIMEQHYALLQRNLLYTAITRGKQLVIVIGTSKALNIAIKNDRPLNRNSALDLRLSTQ